MRIVMRMIENRTRRHSPAALALLGAGATATELAQALGCSQPSASRYLAGLLPAPAGLPDALVELVGAEAAQNIIALIPAHALQAA